jgi:hypothetical protein
MRIHRRLHTLTVSSLGLAIRLFYDWNSPSSYRMPGANSRTIFTVIAPGLGCDQARDELRNAYLKQQVTKAVPAKN